MADVDKTNENPREQLFDRLDDVRAGMLGVQGSSSHMQPMSHFVDREKETLWFITARDTDLVDEIGQGGTAHFCVMDKGQDYYACLSGKITQSQDEAKLDELWNTFVAAWFEGGREDSNVVLLEMPLKEAAIWSSTGSRLVLGMEMARAAMQSDHKPDVGTHTVVNFGRPA